MHGETFALVRPPGETAAPVTIDGHALTLGEVAAVARRGTPVALSRDRAIGVELQRSVALKDALVAAGNAIYGVTTGFGDSAHRQIAGTKAEALQRTLVQMLGCGVGSLAPADEARATVLVRANCLARGHSGVRPVVVKRLLDLLNRDIVPAIPEQGSVGASGDLVPLSYVAAALQGERQVLHEGRLRPAADALAACGLEPLALSSKEGLALVNGTSFMAAIAGLATLDARAIAGAADLCTALTVEALEGMAEPFDRFVHDRAKPHPGQVLSARNVRHLLEGSRLVRGTEAPGSAGTVDESRVRALPRRVQDRYSVRCASQFIGALWDTLDWVERWLSVEVNSSNDNPLFDVETGRALNAGNFAGSHVGLAMDALRTAVASVGDLLDRQLALLVDEKFSEGLPPNLAPAVTAGDPDEGLHHGFKGMQIVASALTAEALQLCTPATIFSRSTECHNQDKVSMATIAARRTREVVRLIERVVAIHLLASCQAADLRGPARLGRTAAAYRRIRAVSAPLGHDRPLEGDIEAVVGLVRDGSLFAALGMPAGPQESWS